MIKLAVLLQQLPNKIYRFGPHFLGQKLKVEF